LDNCPHAGASDVFDTLLLFEMNMEKGESGVLGIINSYDHG
jgi:hypothetical protein